MKRQAHEQLRIGSRLHGGYSAWLHIGLDPVVELSYHRKPITAGGKAEVIPGRSLQNENGCGKLIFS